METPPATPQVASQPPPKEEDLISSTDFTLFAAASAQAVADTVTEDRKNQRDYYILTTRFESELHTAQVDSDRRQHGLQQVIDAKAICISRFIGIALAYKITNFFYAHRFKAEADKFTVFKAKRTGMIAAARLKITQLEEKIAEESVGLDSKVLDEIWLRVPWVCEMRLAELRVELVRELGVEEFLTSATRSGLH